MARHPILVGPAGWSYSDWEGVVYPSHGRKLDQLAYLAHYFDTIEVNSSFYRIPPDTHSKSWVRRVAENGAFRFTVKLFREFTHGENFGSELVDPFRSFLEPLVNAGRLGALLIQFPWSFRATEEGLARIDEIVRRFPDVPRAVEVRHASFQTDEFMKFLDERDTAFVNIDQPRHHDSVRPSAISVGSVNYVRFHGRNFEKWFQHGEAWERYDYLYSAEELQPWVSAIDEMAVKNPTYVIMNNHFRGQAIVNAIEVKEALGIGAEIPPTLAEQYPDRFPASGGLFGATNAGARMARPRGPKTKR